MSLKSTDIASAMTDMNSFTSLRDARHQCPARPFWALAQHLAHRMRPNAAQQALSLDKYGIVSCGRNARWSCYFDGGQILRCAIV